MIVISYFHQLFQLFVNQYILLHVFSYSVVNLEAFSLVKLYMYIQSCFLVLIECFLISPEFAFLQLFLPFLLFIYFSIFIFDIDFSFGWVFN